MLAPSSVYDDMPALLLERALATVPTVAQQARGHRSTAVHIQQRLHSSC